MVFGVSALVSAFPIGRTISCKGTKFYHYVVNMEEWKQKNMHTGTVRRIRRLDCEEREVQ